MLLAFIPLVNLVLLVFFITDGVAGPNEYGPDPKGAYAPTGYAPSPHGAAQAVAASAPARWLADPTGRHQMRYWDALRWTEHVSDDGVTAVDPVQA